MSHESDSEDLRAALTRIDRQIAKLVDERAAVLLRPPPVGASMPPRDPTSSVHDDDRPAPKHVRPATMDAILESVRRACAEVGKPLRIVFPAVFERDAAAAAVGRWGARASLHEEATIESALDVVSRGQADFAMLPFAIAEDGFHRPTLRALAAAEARITDCVVAPASRDAVGRTDATATPHTVFVGRGDRPFVHDWLTGTAARIVEVHTASEACELASRDGGTWAIATTPMGAAHGLVVHATSIADDPLRRVVLALVGGRPPSRTGRDHVAVVLSPHEGPGALADVLRELAEQRLNVATIESMPMAQESQDSHVFLVIEGHVTDRSIVLAFERLRKLVRALKVVGGYAIAV